MATSMNQARAAANEAVIFLRPFDDFYVSSSSIHDLDSSIAFVTARSWYFFASSPDLPEIVTGFATFEWTKFR
jgi:hypothetical protein